MKYIAQIDGGAQYRGYVLYAQSDDTFWVVGEERWMTEEQIDALAEGSDAE